MITVLEYLVIAAVIGLVVFGITMFVFGRGEQLAALSPRTSPSELPDGAIGGDDVHRVRFGLALRGYRMSDVDWTLDKLADEVDRLHRRVAELGGGPTPPSVTGQSGDGELFDGAPTANSAGSTTGGGAAQGGATQHASAGSAAPDGATHHAHGGGGATDGATDGAPAGGVATSGQNGATPGDPLEGVSTALAAGSPGQERPPAADRMWAPRHGAADDAEPVGRTDGPERTGDESPVGVVPGAAGQVGPARRQGMDLPGPASSQP